MAAKLAEEENGRCLALAGVRRSVDGISRGSGDKENSRKNVGKRMMIYGAQNERKP